MAQTNLWIKLLVCANSFSQVPFERLPVSTHQEIPDRLITWRFIGLFWGETVVSQTNLVDLFTSYYYKIHLNNITNSTHSFIHSVIWLTTDPLPLPKRHLHRVLSRASSFNLQYSLFFLLFQPLLSFRLSLLHNVFWKAVHMQDVTNRVSPFLIDSTSHFYFHTIGPSEIYKYALKAVSLFQVLVIFSNI